MASDVVESQSILLPEPCGISGLNELTGGPVGIGGNCHDHERLSSNTIAPPLPEVVGNGVEGPDVTDASVDVVDGSESVDAADPLASLDSAELVRSGSDS